MSKKYMLPLSIDIETKEVLRQVNIANKKLAELKGIVQTIPNEAILINTLTLQEAKDSSEIENIITTHDELYKSELNEKSFISSASSKEVLNYRETLQLGFNLIKDNKILSNNIILEIQKCLEKNKAGFRKIPGTTLKNNYGEIVYEPPQDANEIVRLMNNLEIFINDTSVSSLDPLIKMAIIHHQFESIHPFYDGNGRTGRIISVLFLLLNDLLDLPILYLSRYCIQNKQEYYNLLQSIRNSEHTNTEDWINWIMFNLKVVERTAMNTISLVKAILNLMQEIKMIIRPEFGKRYSHELLNHLFFHPYTKIEYMMEAMNVERKTASKYLNQLVKLNILEVTKIKQSNYYINVKLFNLLSNDSNKL